MRLTLRTLLAYLDEVLPAPQAEEIGKKLQESPMGNSLVRRIQDVLRQRRLSSPSVTGPGMGIDPNAVAEYLDGTLPADGIASVERICLESDLHLAEVAGCHQILALALEEPAELPPRIRERMIALGPHSARVMAPTVAATGGLGELSGRELANRELSGQALSSVLAQAPSAGSAGIPVPGVTAPATSPAATVSPNSSFEAGLPDYLKTNRDKSRWWMYAVATIVLAGWGFLTFRSSPFGASSGGAATEVPAGSGDMARDAGPSEEFLADATTAGPGNESASPTPDGGTNVVAVPEGPGLPDVENDPDVDSPPYRKQGGRPQTAEAGGQTARPPGSRALTGGEAEGSNTSAGSYTSSEGIALAWMGDEESWRVQKAGTAVPVGREFAAPQPFEAQVEIPEVQLSLQPGSRMVLQPSARGTNPAVMLRTGRMLVRPNSQAGGASPTTVELHLTQAKWLVTLSPDAVLGVESVPPLATRFEQRAGVDPGRGALHLASGRADVVHLGDREFAVELRGPATLELPVAESDEAAARPAVTTDWRAPDWMTPSKPTSSSRTAATLFARSFSRDDAVESAVSGIVNDSNPRLSELAAQSLALMGNVAELVKVLKSNRHEEARRTAILGLRHWLVSEAGDPDLLKEQLALRYTTREAETVYKLLWGYSRRDAQNKTKSAFLVGLLSDPELSIRALALHHLKSLTGQDFNFHPNATDQQRASSIRQWKHHLRNHGDCLIRPDGDASADDDDEEGTDGPL